MVKTFYGLALAYLACLACFYALARQNKKPKKHFTTDPGGGTKIKLLCCLIPLRQNFSKKAFSDRGGTPQN